MQRLIDLDAFLAAEMERCGGCIPLVGTCTMDNDTLEHRLLSQPIIIQGGEVGDKAI